MQRTVLVEMADEMAARSLRTLRPVEDRLRRDHGTDSTRAAVALVQQVEALRLTLLALVAPEGT